ARESYELQRAGIEFFADAAQILLVDLQYPAVGPADALVEQALLQLLLRQVANLFLKSSGQAKQQQDETDAAAGEHGIARVLRGLDLACQVDGKFAGFGERDDLVGAGLANRCIDFEDRRAQRALVVVIVAFEAEARDHLALQGADAGGAGWETL